MTDTARQWAFGFWDPETKTRVAELVCNGVAQDGAASTAPSCALASSSRGGSAS
jgi:hypothetical protein